MTEFDISSGEISSAPSTERTRSKPHVSSSGLLSTADLLQALPRLDNRCVPNPEAFDSQSGQSFQQFLLAFEEYPQHNFRRSSALWIGELGRLLTGDMNAAFQALKVPGDSYRSLTKKLLKWRTDTKEVLESKTKYRFTKAKIQAGESLRLYAARLEKAFRLAYPSRRVEFSKTLRQKYFDTAPNAFRKQLQTARTINLTMNKSEISWSTILTLASQNDVGAEHSHGEHVDQECEQVWVAHGSRPGIARTGFPVTSCDVQERTSGDQNEYMCDT